MTKQEKGKYVRIQSSVTIQVTAGLQHEDVTNKDAHVPDRLKVSPEWPKTTVLIVAGTHMYPSEIVEWNTVKALENANIITIGAYSDEADDDVAKTKEELELALKELEAKEAAKNIAAAKELKLADIAGE